ncbi:ubiquitin-conjugating enzyme [Cordyceps fumosorosea ARSEF 2679]|uniref:Ubiquitin-conjugating enzyme n=1 Tax=Cordyceps fumosorosea (strain ARSEF 2679) TaxID=1081104 RepID=A0A167UD76_CORFA|nr:ubiquitin-conjugating enzyme [Cordyceps fumosorosea ARSEF 2679]OAA61469.1 ubiquitin-conjugating enzyme [Cordyceps fumosorosea ARSEF 2679]
MSLLKLANLPSLRRQQLLSEFTGLKQACPSGVFVTLNPGDSTVWSAVLFIREGPYAPAVLRFQIMFPDSYPRRAPMIIFTTDVFHPLVTPLTTYTYTTDIQDNGTVSATDDERLPPGGFSLRHGFPEWFGRVRRSAEASLSAPTSPIVEQTPGFASPNPVGAASPAGPSYMQTTSSRPASMSMYQVLKYIKNAFDRPEVLDAVPLDAAGNPGAWHAWRTYRRKQQATGEKQGGASDGSPATPSPKKPTGEKKQAGQAVTRKPGEWNWDGVWEDRVKKGVAASLSEPVLYGGTTINDEMIRFLSVEDAEAESIKDNLLRTLGTTV